MADRSLAWLPQEFSLKLSTDGKGDVEALLLCPERVLITGKDDVKLWSSNGLVTVVVPAGSVFSPITSNYHEDGFSDMPEMSRSFTGAGGCP
ncbi:MAG: hypothetical protein FI715_09610 [SAR202 cluster bacterium]|nr:hypothetical protein [SAR202 cluster bacterium]